MDISPKTEVEEVVLQALGHEERRNILKIIGASTDGVTYSSILGETGLDTGHLNYHLRGLEGLIEKDDDKIYKLTPLGVRFFVY
jgi:predicted transcriptional regulator